MDRQRTIGITWAALAIIYGLSVALTDGDRYITIGGAMLFALLAVLSPMLFGDKDTGRGPSEGA